MMYITGQLIETLDSQHVVDQQTWDDRADALAHLTRCHRAKPNERHVILSTIGEFLSKEVNMREVVG